MKILVTDANIFIDLDYLDRAHWLKYLGGEIHTTDVVLQELYEEQVAVFTPYINFIAEADIATANSLLSPDIYSRLSDADRSVIWYAQHKTSEDTVLLTGDNAIRKWCLKNRITVHGILWIFDELVAGNHIHTEEACELLLKLRRLNLWLPQSDCEERIKRWSDP